MGLFNNKNNKPNAYTNESRQKRQQKRRVVLLIIFSLIILLLSLFSFIIFNEAITSCKNENPRDTDDTTAEEATDITDETEEVKKSCFSCAGFNKSKDTTESQAEAKKLTYDVDKYVLKTSDDIKKGDLLLIDNNHLYQFPDSNPNIYALFDKRTEFPDGIRSIKVIDTNKPTLDIKTINALNAMADAFYSATGETGLQAQIGYVTKQEQQTSFDKAVSTYQTVEAAKLHEALAGGSEYNTGLAVKLGVYTNGATYTLDSTYLEGKYNWIYENCYKYGFILRYPAAKTNLTGVNYEPYQFRYVGYEHAYYMYNNNLCFEEYLNLLRTSYTCTSENVATAPHLVINGDNGLKYEIYYVAASAAQTTVPVPNNAPYSISGDNVSGFIVTVTVN